jgi:hypothetical protein
MWIYSMYDFSLELTVILILTCACKSEGKTGSKLTKNTSLIRRGLVSGSHVSWTLGNSIRLRSQTSWQLRRT